MNSTPDSHSSERRERTTKTRSNARSAQHDRKRKMSLVSRGITGGKATEVRLRESESRYRTLFDYANDALYFHDEDGKILDINQVACKRLGYTREEMLKMSLNDINSSENVALLPERIQAILKQRYAVFESRHVRRDGYSFPVEISSRVIPYKGKAAILGIARDLTERRRTEEAVRESEEKFRKAFATSPDACYIGTVKDGIIVEVNDAFVEFFGYTREECVGKTSLSLNMYAHGPPDRARMTAELTSKGYFRNLEFEVRRKSGEIRSVLFSGSILQLSHHELLLGVNRDITERKRMENQLRSYSENLEATVKERTAELRSSRDELERVIEFNPAVVYTAKLLPDLRMEVTYMSRNMVLLSGFEAKKFVGPNGERFWETEVHPDDLAVYRKEVLKFLEKNQKHWSSEYRFRCKDGVYRWIREEFNVVRDSTGNIVDLIGLWTDVTDRRQAQEVEEQRKTELTKQLYGVTDRLESLSRTREKLKTAPDVSTGLDMVLDTIVWNFGLDSGAVLILDSEHHRMNVRAAKSRTEKLNLNQSYPLEGFAELKDLQAKSIIRTVGEGERSILGTRTVYTIPLLAGSEIFGVLVFGSEKETPPEEGDVRVLELYGEMVHSFLVEKSIVLTPVLESKRANTTTSLELGEMYLFNRKPEDAFEAFTNAVFSGHEGLCITRMHPRKVRSKFGLEKTPIVWLTNQASADEQCAHSIQDLSIIIGDYLKRAEKAAVLIDGFEYLIINHGFDAFMQFLQILRDRIQIHDGILIAPIHEQSLPRNEIALIEREMQLYSQG